MATPFDLKKTNRYLPHIALVGTGIGTANYFLNDQFNWLQWILLSLSTSFIIGYTLIGISLSKSWYMSKIKPAWKIYLILLFAFFLVGAVATEVEYSIRILVFSDQTYRLFSAGKMYLFNGTISLVLGYSFFQNIYSFPKGYVSTKNDNTTTFSLEPKPKDVMGYSNPIAHIPVKTGENIFLVPIAEIVYFEAFDNYAFVLTQKGVKKLCDYSLLFLEKRLGPDFLRIHRKYIVNINHIKQIKPYLNGRYVILFDTPHLSAITSSKSYAAVIRKLIKIE
ncbi:MAG: LytTR family DNA-binding domain-containing protein [Bacteroidota bacterium]